MEHFFGNVEREPWKDLRLIKALRLATDRYELQKAFGSGHYLLGAPFPPGSLVGQQRRRTGQTPRLQPAQAEGYRGRQGVAQGSGLRSPRQVGQASADRSQYIVLARCGAAMGGADAKDLGLEIEIKLVDAPTAVNTWVSGGYDLGSWGYAYNIDDPDDYVTAIYGPGSRNFTRWQNPAFLKILDQQRSELDRDKRQQILRQMEKFLLTQEEPYMPLFWARRSYW